MTLPKTDDFVLPTWRQRLARSLHLHRSKAEAKYFQLATYCNEHGVQNRTVVFRGFAPNSNTFWGISEANCAKVDSLRRHADAQICWYFAKTREQYRLSVQATIQDGNAFEQASRINVWQNISESARLSFFAQAPESWLAEGDKSTPPANFVVLAFQVNQVDYLQLTEPHQRYLAIDDGVSWTERAIPA